MTPPAENPRPSAARPAARLVVTMGTVQFRVVIAADTFSIGSSPRSSLALDRPGVDEHHAVIQRTGDGFEVFSLSAEAGIVVNGRRVEAAPLKSGDSIGISDARLQLLIDDPVPAASITAEILPLLAMNERPAAAASPAPSPPPVRALAEGERTPLFPIAAIPPAQPSFRTIADAELRPKDVHEWIVLRVRQVPYIALAVLLHAIALLVVSLVPEHRSLVIESPEREIEFIANLPPPPPATTETPPEPEPERGALPRADDQDVVIPTTPSPELPDQVLPTAGGEGGGSDFGVPMGDDLAARLPSGTGVDTIGLGPGGFGGGDGEHGANGSSLGPDDGVFGGTGRGSGGFGGLRRYAQGLREVGLDVIFVVDATGSMGVLLEDARRRINELIAVIGTLVPHFRLALVAYRDKGDDFITAHTTLDDVHYRTVQFLDDLTASGGGDFPEAVYDGLRVGIRDLPWSKTNGRAARRIVILVGDAPPHVYDDAKIEALVKSFGEQRGTLHTIYCGGNGTLEERDTTRQLFARLAKLTGGLGLSLGDGTKVVDKLLPVIFGKEYELGMKEAIENARLGPRARRCRELVASASATTIRDELIRPTPSVELFSALADNLKKEHLPAFLDALKNPDTPAPARWAACVFVRRLMASIPRAPQLVRAAAPLAGNLPPAKLNEIINDVKRKARTAGLLTELPAEASVR